MGLVVKTDCWRIPEELWAKMEPLLPPRPAHPLGCHNPRVPDRDALNAILFVLRTGCQWSALDATGICTSTRRKRFSQEWVRSTTQRRARRPASRLIARASSPRERTWAVKPNSAASS
jgi:transposase